MNENSRDFAQRIKSQATVLAEAYRLRLLGRLWWANLILVVLPAALATAAAIFAARQDVNTAITSSYVAAWLAGSAAVFTAIHKALRCDEYQAECLRLSQAYQSIAIEADSSLASLETDGKSLQELAKKYAMLAESAKAPLPDGYIKNAEKRTGEKLYFQRAK